MKRYPKYKESGVPWLGQLPSHWNVKRLKRLFSETNEKARDGDEQLAATQKYGVISQSQFMKEEDQKLVLALKGTDNFKHVEQDDFVISLRAFEGGIERSNQSGCVSPAYTVLRSGGELAPSYSAKLLKTPAFIAQISMTYDGIREGKAIKFKDAGPVFLPIPPADEQAHISNFIDDATRKIDLAISSQERMTELLKERRSVIITQAVTKGLDPKAKMKDSGVTWLGRVPAHWEVKGLKFLLSANQGGAWGDEPTGLGDTIVLRSTEQTQTGEWRIEDPEVRSLSETERKKTLLKKGDILVTKASGSEAHIGKASLVDDAVASLNAGYSNFMQRLRARPGIEPQLILFMLNSKAVRDQFVYLSNSTSGLGNISASVLNNVLVAEPPESEQFGIVEHIAKECRSIDSAINKVERMIELLKERRSALITQAVTGQIDVR